MCIKKLIIFIFAGLMLNGCQAIKAHDTHYLKSTLGEPLQVPEGLRYKKENDTYPLPPKVAEHVTVPSIEPPGFGRLDS